MSAYLSATTPVTGAAKKYGMKRRHMKTAMAMLDPSASVLIKEMMDT